ncbi:MAG: hypothetical protein ACP5U1_14820 [Desulfomonilaceae bacterium]
MKLVVFISVSASSGECRLSIRLILSQDKPLFFEITHKGQKHYCIRDVVAGELRLLPEKVSKIPWDQYCHHQWQMILRSNIWGLRLRGGKRSTLQGGSLSNEQSQRVYPLLRRKSFFERRGVSQGEPKSHRTGMNLPVPGHVYFHDHVHPPMTALACAPLSPAWLHKDHECGKHISIANLLLCFAPKKCLLFIKRGALLTNA